MEFTCHRQSKEACIHLSKVSLVQKELEILAQCSATIGGRRIEVAMNHRDLGTHGTGSELAHVAGVGQSGT
jgi:hypothetical protein